MPSTIEAEETFLVGEETFVGCKSPTSQYGAFFEDDGDTGYFYGLDTSVEGNQIRDALHIYNVASVVDKGKPSLVQIEWSEDGMKAAFFINGYAMLSSISRVSAVIAERTSLPRTKSGPLSGTNGLILLSTRFDDRRPNNDTEENLRHDPLAK